MAQRFSQLRVFWPTVLTSLILLAICVIASVYLYRQQSDSAAELGENIGSRQAAGKLTETLRDLSALHQRGALQVEALHDRVQSLLNEIRLFADKPEEKAQVQKLAIAFQHYLERWRSIADAKRVTEAQTIIDDEMLPMCHSLHAFNVEQIQESERNHHRALRLMAWGLAGVSAAGALAGLIFGFGVARRLQRSIHQLRVRVQDAADKLGQDLPAVELADESLEGLNQNLREVVRQVEQVVQTLQDREREVLRAEQLAAVGRLAAGVAHEIRNPLTSIKMLVQTGHEEAIARGLPAEDLHVIELEVRRIERSLQTFLDFARPPKVCRKPTDLALLPDHVANLVRGRAARQGVEIRLIRSDSPVVAEADADQMRQVLLNLVLNALDVMPQGGELKIEVRSARNGSVELGVSDTGPGIADAIMPRLFEPFVSDKEMGLGLGLSVSRRIVDDHQGMLRAQNRPEGGACFKVVLPRNTSQPSKRLEPTTTRR